MRLVVKYGGNTIDTASKVRHLADRVHQLNHTHQVVIVCSAAGNTTDILLDMSSRIRAADHKDVARLLHDMVAYHTSMVSEVANDSRHAEDALSLLSSAFDELRSLIDGLLLLGETTPLALDYLMSFGERFSSIVVAAALQSRGVSTEVMSGKEAGILTDSNFGRSRPLMDTTRLRVSRMVGSRLSEGVVPIIGGYSGADQHGHVTTFGRGGSDYTATIMGSCLDADEVWLMDGTGGMMSADPAMVQGARTLDVVSYAEAIEMAMFGAKRIHPHTFEPVLDGGIPLRVRSADTDSKGTLVCPDTSDTVKCVSVIRGNGLIDIRGFGMVGSPGTAAGIFGTLAGPDISVMMISQNPSESSITVVVRNKDLHRAVHELEAKHLGREIKRLDVTTDVAVVALIGSGLRGTVGTAARVFGAVRDRSINVIMITQGSSEMNLAFVVRDGDAAEAARALHDEFGLDAGR